MKRRVLIVDDERVIREVQAEYLQSLPRSLWLSRSATAHPQWARIGLLCGCGGLADGWDKRTSSIRSLSDSFTTRVVISLGDFCRAVGPTVFRMGSLLRSPFRSGHWGSRLIVSFQGLKPLSVK